MSESLSDVIALADGGRFEIIRKLATGGMAQIFLARKVSATGIERVVVLKRILEHLTEDTRFVEMFTQEAKLAALLVHPNVAQVYDMGRDTGGHLYYAMEYVAGRDLRGVVKGYGGKLPLDVVLATVAGAAAGLHYAHSLKDPRGNPLNVVHRDVTPSNIMLTFDGGVKVVDFGVAKAAIEGRESTAVGVLKGKVPYMSPEQVLGTEHIDGRSDIFSLGTCLWELTTHRRLFRRDNQVESIRAIADASAPPPSSVVEDYPPQLERIVLKALERERDDRYASARELQADLEAFALSERLALSSSRISAFMSEHFDEAREEGEAMLAAESASMSEVATVVSAPNTTSVAVPPANSVEGPMTEQAPPKAVPWLPIAAVAILLAGGGGAALFMNSGDQSPAARDQAEPQVEGPASAGGQPPAPVAAPVPTRDADRAESGADERADASGDAELVLEDEPAAPTGELAPTGEVAPTGETAPTGQTAPSRKPASKKKKRKTKKAWNKNALLPPT